MSDRTKQREIMATGKGFIAALDQSGGSTPKALRLYGIQDDAYSNEDEMFNLVHQMRTRIITSPVFSGDRILAAILFEQTMDREISGIPTATFLWEKKRVVPFLKIDKGLAEESFGVQLMKPIPNLDELLEHAVDKGIFGTKMRSVIKSASPTGIAEIVDQQFEVGRQVGHHNLVPILEPEVDIHAHDKKEAEELLKGNLLKHLNELPEGCEVMLKLTIPSVDDFYADLISHPRVLRVVALSGGYSREEANRLLTQNSGLIASFSRALSEGLSADQSDDEFNKTLKNSIDAIYKASLT